jgi:type I restriction enzyme S subunit
MTSYPSNWQIESLDSLINRGIIRLNRGDIISKLDIAAHPGEYPIYSSAKENNGMFGRYGKFMFDEEVITWSIDGGGRLFYREKQKFSVTNVGGIMRILDRSVFDYKFLFYALTNLHSQVIFDWSRKAHPSVIRLVYDKIPIPPLNEQLRIVEILENHLTRLDVALAEVKQAKTKAAQFRKSLLLSLMSSDYAGSSSDWTRTTLGNVCNLIAGKTPPSLERSIDGIDDSSRTVPFYKVGDMNLHSEFLCESRLYLSAKQVEDRKLFILPIGSVVFPKAGGAIATNKKRVISVPGPIDLNCMAAIPIQGTNPKYLSWWFQSINLSSYADGSILPQLSKGKMSEIPVDWPNLKLQEEIVLKLENSLSKNSEATKMAEVIEANSSALRRSLLQAAFTGQLTKEVVSV